MRNGIFLLLLLCLLLAPRLVYSQKHDNYHFQADSTLIDFTNNLQTQIANAFLNNKYYNDTTRWFAAYPCASISNELGVLQLYSQGINFMNGIHEEFQDTLSPLGYISWGLLVLPQPQHSNIYYLFRTGDYMQSSQGPVSADYSVIDMSLNGGNGGFVPNLKEISLFGNEHDIYKIQALKHANGRDWWVYFQRYPYNLYTRFLLTPEGLCGPWHQAIGYLMQYQGPPRVMGWGQMDFSSDGKKMANVSSLGLVQIFNVDRTTGLFTNPVIIELPADKLPGIHYGLIGCVFSPNSRYLYTCDETNLYQYDTYASPILSSKQLIATIQHGYEGCSNPVPEFDLFMGITLTPDNKLYLKTLPLNHYPCSSKKFHFIYNPNEQGQNCDFKQYDFDLKGKSGQSLPLNLPHYRLGAESLVGGMEALPVSGCAPLGVAFWGKGGAYTAAAWDFGDGSPVDTITIGQAWCKAGGSIDTFHIYTQPGIYTARLTLWQGSQLVTMDTVIQVRACLAPQPSIDTLQWACAQALVDYHYRVQGAVRGMQWQFSDTSLVVRDVDSVRRDYTQPGTYQTTVWAYSMTDTVSHTFSVVVDSCPPPPYYITSLYPNPSDGSFRLDYHTEVPLLLTVYDAAGKLVYRSELPAGHYTAVPVRLSVAAGIYLCRFRSGNQAKTQKLLILK